MFVRQIKCIDVSGVSRHQACKESFGERSAFPFSVFYFRDCSTRKSLFLFRDLWAIKKENFSSNSNSLVTHMKSIPPRQQAFIFRVQVAKSQPPLSMYEIKQQHVSIIFIQSHIQSSHWNFCWSRIGAAKRGNSRALLVGRGGSARLVSH